MPVITNATLWDNPWAGGDVLIAASVSNFSGTLFPTPPTGGWQVGYRRTPVAFDIYVPAASPPYFAAIYVDTGAGHIGSAVSQPLVGGGVTRITIPLTYGGADITGAQIAITDGVSALADGVAYLRSIEFPLNLFWTALVGCVEA